MKTYIKPELNIEKLNLKEVILESAERKFNGFLGEEPDETIGWDSF